MFQLHVGVSDVTLGQKVWYQTINTWMLTAHLSTLLFVNLIILPSGFLCSFNDFRNINNFGSKDCHTVKLNILTMQINIEP
jgi:hypothetical protein